MLDRVTRVAMLVVAETSYLIPLSSVYLSINFVQCSICLRDFEFLQCTENLDEVTKLLPIRTGNCCLRDYVCLTFILFFSKREKD